MTNPFKIPEEEAHGAPLDPSSLVNPYITRSVTLMYGAIEKSIAEAIRTFTLKRDAPPPPPPVEGEAEPEGEGDPKPEAMLQAIKKIHAVYYACITASILLLKTTDLGTTSSTYHPLLNYNRVNFIKIDAKAAYFVDTALVLLGLIYGGSQVGAQIFRVPGDRVYDFVSIYIGGLMVCALMAGVSGLCGFIVTVFMAFMLGFVSFLPHL